MEEAEAAEVGFSAEAEATMRLHLANIPTGPELCKILLLCSAAAQLQQASRTISAASAPASGQNSFHARA